MSNFRGSSEDKGHAINRIPPNRVLSSDPDMVESSNMIMKGTRADHGSRKKAKVYGDTGGTGGYLLKRQCAREGCLVTLSRYNSQHYCFAHHERKYGRVRGARRS